ncbi:hypothetical protein CGLO_14970 [Colletotrichum gloeosporioides Cg-14]|uniref:Uncharacterized protein n=1 Tax=Colletotrichum gloeosporioides (strain Cg-14) TaxID=1237896 RepID=T0JZT9_COLGC|nr:hypothetical protein CGLO_14970 [Colletotrichum gloeosporioides Cg-14]
MSRIYLKGGY